ncbi:MAG: hypothetical protein R3B97_08225 [Dehalococcoidia bacterium]|nr:hypothetical protein [Dehalococcoidia bacterium]MCB9486689.1 hypothetical protein [Thermoflexaceae bacterium]
MTKGASLATGICIGASNGEILSFTTGDPAYLAFSPGIGVAFGLALGATQKERPGSPKGFPEARRQSTAGGQGRPERGSL